MRNSNTLGMLGVTALATLLGCASLNVTVDVYVGDAVLRNHLAEQVEAIENSGLCRESGDELRSTLIAEIKESWSAGARTFDPKATPADIERLWKGVESQLGSEAWTNYLKKVQDVCAVEGRAKKVLTKVSRKIRNVPSALLAAELSEAQRSASKAYRDIARAVGDEALGRLVLQAEPIGFSATAIASDDSTNGRVAGFPVFDPNIKVLLSDEPTVTEQNNGISRWKTSNKVRATASGGNSQFVLVQQGLMTFHQKSLDFDPAAVIAMVADATRMGLQIASSVASAAGMPIPINLGGGTSAPSSTAPATEAASSESIARVDQVIEDRQNVIDRCMLDLSGFLHANEQVDDKNVVAKNDELEALIRKCQGNLDQVARP